MPSSESLLPHVLTKEQIAIEFPVPTSTSVTDKSFLVGAVRFFGKRKLPYRYLEIGSHLGGSLVPFLRDPNCVEAVSIDERGLVVPDERGRAYSFVGVTHDTMLDLLKKNDVTVEKLSTFDGSIDAYKGIPKHFDLAFIDGEHTDEACFRDLMWTIPLMRDDSLIMFHDSSLIYKAIRLFMVYLRRQNIRYSFIKKADCEVSALRFGALCDLVPDPLMLPEESEQEFFDASETKRIRVQFKNRGYIGFDMNRLSKFKFPLTYKVGRLRKAGG